MLRIQTKQKKSWYLFAVSWLYCKHLSCRAISVILGDRWKKMKNEERRMYTLEAKALAEEQKRLNPDCWKRKRTNSVCLWSNLFHYAVTYVQRCGYSVFCSEDTFLVAEIFIYSLVLCNLLLAVRQKTDQERVCLNILWEFYRFCCTES